MGEVFTIVDIGTTKISVVRGSLENGTIEVSFFRNYPCSGIKKGKVVDMESLTSSIRRSLQDVEDTLKVKVKKAFVCSSGSEIQGIYTDASIKIKKKEITEKDVELVIESATAVEMPSQRQVVHILPVEFIVDDVDGIKNPIGMKGLRLTCKVYIVTASANHIQSVVSCCKKAGIEVEDFILQSIASAEATLTKYDREIGTMVVDIGGGNTDIAVFYEGYLRHITVFGIGGNHITSDLAIGLKIPFQEAERIKTQFGVALPDINFGQLKFQENNKEIEIVGVDKKPARVSLSVVKEIIYARCEEILEFIKKEITLIPQDISVSSIVFTGGCSLMPGFIPLAEGFLSIPARIGSPDIGLMAVSSEIGLNEDFSQQSEIGSFTPELSSAIGTLIYAVKSKQFQALDSGVNMIDKIKRWIKNFIKI